MPTEEVLKQLQDLYMADDIEIPADATGWTEKEAEAYFESGGEFRPPAAATPAPAPAATPAELPALPTAAPAPPSTPPGVFRWLVDIASWEPTDAQWRLLLSLIPEEDATKVKKFHFVADQKRALVSRLLQRRACFEATGVPYKDVRIERTKGSKPFMANKPAASPGEPCKCGSPNWNFNVSHEGNYVTLASEPTMVCGVDVAAPEVARPGRKARSIHDTLQTMTGQLTLQERSVIDAARPNERKMEDLFRRFWSLKEAYTKGRGDGLGFEFNRCDFKLGEVGKGAHGQPVQFASVAVDGKSLPAWKFYIQELEESHWISVARGPPSDIVDAQGKFKSTFTDQVSDLRIITELNRPEHPFEMKLVGELVPNDAKAEYASLGKA